MGIWTWSSSYNGFIGGIPNGKNILPGGDGVGTGGVTITSINGVAVATFSAFSNKLEISSHFNRGDKKNFELVSNFTLGSTSDGISPLTEATVLSVGSYHVMIPAGSFHKKSKGYYVYEGTIDNVQLEVQIVPRITTANTYTLKAEGKGVPLTATKPVGVALEIGNDLGFGVPRLHHSIEHEEVRSD